MHAARGLLAHLAARGVRDVVLCPGSRSGPLAHALAEAADGMDGAPPLSLHVRIDERSAAFLALGLAVGGGRPAAIVTTSGTALGNLLPAAMEASHSGVPLVLVTADRPERLWGTGANQTTRQRGIFGHFVRAEAEFVTHPDATAGAAHSAAGRAVDDAWAAAAAHPAGAGPVHLNVQFDTPLEHAAGPWPAVADVPPAAAATTYAGVAAPPAGCRGIVVAGAGDTAGAAEFAAARGWPLLAEPASNARSGPAAIAGYAALLATPRGRELAAEAEAIVAVGRPTLSRHTAALLRDPARLWLAGWNGDARERPAAAGVATVLPHAWHAGPAPESWLALWHAAAQLDDAEWGPAGVAAAVCAALRAGDVLVAGSSGPIRALDAVLPIDAGIEVLANRGLAGIDGTIATAVGVALARGVAVTAVMGDVTFAHDAGGLLIGPLEARPDLRIVVVNDGGGTIFSGLEHAAADPSRFERVFTTPHGLDPAQVAAAYGARASTVRSRAELDAALATPPSGVEVVDARIRG